MVPAVQVLEDFFTTKKVANVNLSYGEDVRLTQIISRKRKLAKHVAKSKVSTPLKK